ncbi:MAG: hypothetical protein H6867_01630 [Rhodospirillales bacterium]|nr:hypothetical protein [Rhodospirillales bacterium]MCB9997218.1 hypothetical protein [Rhodospirillales bacterium]
MIWFKKLHHLFLSVGMACLLVMPFAVQAAAPDVKPGCDPEIMDALEAKAWMHAQRRVAQNKNLILKPDSVLEYSCFNQHLGYLAANPGRRFSEEVNYWGPIAGITPTSLDNALFNTVTAPLVSYLQANFFHTFLAGRMTDVGGAPPPYGTYNCHAMEIVWEEARCMQFMDLEAIDGFFDFPWYRVNDPRRIPPAFQCAADGRFTPAIVETYRGRGQDLLHGDEWPLFVLQAENDPVRDPILYKEDPIVINPIIDKIIPDNCNKSAIVPTGVHIEIPGEKNFPENVCSIPGCSYDGAQCVLD